ncbi:hypothetical protein EAO72_20775 [Streptomyces sp. or43]|nr:hypothetical protein EAO72_20775 [Streptomyces sp. or43]
MCWGAGQDVSGVAASVAAVLSAVNRVRAPLPVRPVRGCPQTPDGLERCPQSPDGLGFPPGRA